VAIRILAGALLVLVLFAAGWAYHLTSSVAAERTEFEKQVQEWVEKRTEISEIESIDEYRGKESYAVVIGKNRAGTPVVVWLTEEKTVIGRMDLAVPRENVEAAIAQNFPGAEEVRIVPGLDGDQRFWEVTLKDQDGRYHYLHYDLYTGALLTSYVLSPAR